MVQQLSSEIFFIVDGLRLESQACLLAPTLKRYLMPHQRAIAYVREDTVGNLAAFTLEVMQASNVEVRTIPNTNKGHAPWQSPYPQGNKILAAATSRKCDISVFLDTDTILTEPVEFADELGDALIAACVSDYASSAGTEEDWEAYYGAFDMDLPVDRVSLNNGRRLRSLPYFNAGVIVFREKDSDGQPLNVGRDWLKAALWFERNVTRDYSRSNIDQFTLPILGYLRKMPVKLLDHRMNFNIQAFGDGAGQRQSIAHYHRLGYLWRHSVHGRKTLEILAEVVGGDAPETFLKVFGHHARRKNMKHHLRAMTEVERHASTSL